MRKVTFILLKYSELVVFIIFLIFFVTFSIFIRNFLTPDIFLMILTTGAEIGIMTIGEAYVIITGEIDLSIASVYIFSIYIFITLANFGVPLILCFITTLAYGFIAGLINGILRIRIGVPSFIATLGGLLLWRGLVASLTGGEAIFYRSNSSVLLEILAGKIGFIPMQFIWFIFFLIVFTILLTRTKFGNWVYATGGSSETARNLGVNINKVKYICFILCSTLAAFAGVTFLGRGRYLDVVMACGLELMAIASAIIGGVLLTGGKGSIISAGLSALVLQEIEIGVEMYGVPVELFRGIVGVLLLLVAFSNLRAQISMVLRR